MRVLRVTKRLWRALRLRGGVMQETTSWSTRANVTTRRRREGVRVLTHRRPVDVHGR